MAEIIPHGNDTSRGKPYTWVTWITGLLSGEDKCWWKAQYKSHFRFAKKPGDGSFDLAQWQKNHDDMTRARAAELKAAGHRVMMEEQNKFALEGKTGTLAGQCDLVALLKDEDKVALVVDEKSGKVKLKDRFQVYIYMLALPLTWLKGYTIRGEVEYMDGPVDVGPLTEGVKTQIMDTMRKVSSNIEMPRSPSPMECKYCDVLACPDRVQDTKAATGDATKFF